MTKGWKSKLALNFIETSLKLMELNPDYLVWLSLITCGRGTELNLRSGLPPRPEQLHKPQLLRTFHGVGLYKPSS